MIPLSNTTNMSNVSSTCISFSSVHFIINVHGKLFKLMVSELKSQATVKSHHWYVEKDHNKTMFGKNIYGHSQTGVFFLQLLQILTNPDCCRHKNKIYTVTNYILLGYSFILELNSVFPSSIYTQYPIMTKQKQVFRNG